MAATLFIAAEIAADLFSWVEQESKGLVDTILPRSSPHVGFLRHSPKQAMHAHFGTLRQWRARQEKERGGHAGEGRSRVPLVSDPKEPQPVKLTLPRGSPYVGSQRHAPPSPILRFSSTPKVLASPPLPPLLELPATAVSPGGKTANKFSLDRDDISGDFALDSYTVEASVPRCRASSEVFVQLPEDVLIHILSLQVDVNRMRCLAQIARGFPALLKSELVWANRPVCVPPSMIARLAPVLGTWLPVWRRASKLIIPRSAQLVSEVTRREPNLPIEVAWRFDAHLKGDGVEVTNYGRSVRRIEDADEELVVLGDAPLPRNDRGAPYFEVILEDRSFLDGSDSLNDFGIGVTACPPSDIDELGAVADEVPCSWVVDFTQHSVLLSVNNSEAARGRRVNALQLNEGDRVGLRVTTVGSIEVFINGQLSEHLVPSIDRRVPQGVDLFPVLDLYGCTVQLSRTDAEEP